MRSRNYIFEVFLPNYTTFYYLTCATTELPYFGKDFKNGYHLSGFPWIFSILNYQLGGISGVWMFVNSIAHVLRHCECVGCTESMQCVLCIHNTPDVLRSSRVLLVLILKTIAEKNKVKPLNQISCITVDLFSE